MLQLRIAVAVGVLFVAIGSGATRPAAEPAFVGARACASCHPRTHAAWTAGRHSRMLQPANDTTVSGDFSAQRLSLHGHAYQLRARGGEYFITESRLTGAPRERRIDYTLGSRRIQHYLTTLDNGWIVILPPTWDVQRKQWFDNIEIVRPDEGQMSRVGQVGRVGLVGRVGEAEDVDIVQQWNRNCVGCHVSQQENNYSAANRTYATRWTDFGTSCERCHGPGAAHAEHPPASIVRPTRLDPVRSTTICAQCHSLREEIAGGFIAGADYYDFFQPLLEYRPQKATDPSYWPDGRPRRFSNDAIGLWQSACFLKGGVACTNCHGDAHTPNVDRNAQLAPSNNALCTGCHREIGADAGAHSHHASGSAGSSCVECHMPKTVTSIKATMRDHTIGLPAPENTVRFGIPNACTECHHDKTAKWAAAAADRWWPGRRRARFVARAETFTAARAGRRDALDRLIAIAADPGEPPLIQANAVGYLAHYTEPRASAALVSASQASNAAIRSIAIASLADHAGAPRPVVAAALDDPSRAVRIAALRALMARGGGSLAPDEAARFRRVAGEFAAEAQQHQDDPNVQRELGLVQLAAGAIDPAADALAITLQLAPDAPGVRALLALARAGQRRFDEARALLANVPASDPFYKAAHDSLKTPR